MARRKDPEDRTPREEIAAVIAWADRQGFTNIAAALRRVLDCLASFDETPPPKRQPSQATRPGPRRSRQKTGTA
ncbi:MAG TPA: hypothetical protein VNZ53_22795 [Steroidobacteraceae bacterium]|jgi:hypothetical protein|nr:hypothetical protein [Steroidobacteraceae bacterium]